ncbi:MAG: acetate uptake transporter [Candidatus Hydrothermarchaeota archaeon]
MAEAPQPFGATAAVLGLMGFGCTTTATGLHNVGYWGIGPTLAMALAFGGTAQFVAGLIEFRRGALFPGTAFCSYGAFWWSLFILLFTLPGGEVATKPMGLFGFFLMWTFFTIPFCIAVIKHGKFLTLLFWLLILAFILLDLHFAIGFSAVVTGWEITILGLLAIYIAGAILVNTEFQRTVIPLA